MKKIMVLFILMSVIPHFSQSLFGALPQREREALIAFYNSTDGDNWYYNSGWKTPPLHSDGFAEPGTEGQWSGVTVTNDAVTMLNFYQSNLCGTIPSELGNLSQLEVCELDDNDLVGAIPPELGNLANLKRLLLGYNDLSGSIPTALADPANLEILSLGYNALTGEIPSELGNLSKLQTLDLHYNKLSGSIPPQLGNLAQLKYLNLAKNKLNGLIPPQLGQLSNLETLELYRNQLSGGIPGEIGNLTQLTLLLLNNNNLSGSIPAALGKMESLSQLNFSNNRLSGGIPPQLCNLENLNSFELQSNQLSGTLPVEIADMSKLMHIDFSNNRLTGPIPREIGKCPALEVLWMHNNQLSGSLPSQLGNIVNLYSIRLENNRLTGRIPITLANLDLYTLTLDNNQLSGPIPPNFAGMENLMILHLKYNRLSGSIPESVMNIPNLIKFNCGYNCLSSESPALGAWLDSMEPGWASSQCLEKAPPFGEFTTPPDKSTLSGSIALTGWALDDYGLRNVKIYLSVDSGLEYIADAVFVEGARPDVAGAYPNYPDNTNAGWGYMLLTHSLPNGGNGTYRLHAVAEDKYGNLTTLGSKKITVDNANALKPFGTIDLPIQGGTVSGEDFVNWGWVLTPQPNQISIDGSTIDVWVDGVKVGHPVYNHYHSDVAALFPGYANSGGAGAYFHLDTTAYANGMHCIHWTVTDSAGNREGIGSRYFYTENYLGYKQEENLRLYSKDQLDAVPSDKDFPAVTVGRLEPIQICIGKNLGDVSGYSLNHDGSPAPLPIGSTLNKETAVFSWLPGPGFTGNYTLVFVLTSKDGATVKHTVNIEISPDGA